MQFLIMAYDGKDADAEKRRKEAPPRMSRKWTKWSPPAVTLSVPPWSTTQAP